MDNDKHAWTVPSIDFDDNIFCRVLILTSSLANKAPKWTTPLQGTLQSLMLHFCKTCADTHMDTSCLPPAWLASLATSWPLLFSHANPCDPPTQLSISAVWLPSTPVCSCSPSSGTRVTSSSCLRRTSSPPFSSWTPMSKCTSHLSSGYSSACPALLHSVSR